MIAVGDAVGEGIKDLRVLFEECHGITDVGVSALAAKVCLYIHI